MIHFFNPGYETEILNASKHYCSPAPVRKMQSDLSSLPEWYGEENDITVSIKQLLSDKVEDKNPEYKQNEQVDFWGISPVAVHLVHKYSAAHNLNLHIPEWKDEYRYLGSRFASRDVLAAIIDEIPEIDKIILPVFFSNMEDIKKVGNLSLIKSPYSSSGRGLVWLPDGKPGQSERQIIDGMLKRQGQVSCERALDRRLDLSMHFTVQSKDCTRFIGYSIFYTNTRGIYEKSVLANQNSLEQQIMKYIDKHLLEQVKDSLIKQLNKIYSSSYQGSIGVDMLVYFDGATHRLHPCIEINMRKSMGYLAIRFMEKHVHRNSHGFFAVDYFKNPIDLHNSHLEMQKKHPLQTVAGKLSSGYKSLCSVTEETNYRAYVMILS
ncbi:MAG: hypothetical protein LBJ17_09445 [Dysgonamonadaceae bacterium]|jgi:hypothetical protein|nr:hypothetical protein [Dysgonamonadaceae bacterium]